MNNFIPSIKVSLYLSGEDLDFDRVVNSIGIKPTGTRKKENFPPPSIAAGVATDLLWYSVKSDHAIALQDVFAILLEQFQTKLEQLKSTCLQHNLETDFVVILHMKDGDSPEVVLPKEVITFAAAINAEIGFDIYCYENEDNSEDSDVGDGD